MRLRLDPNLNDDFTYSFHNFIIQSCLSQSRAVIWQDHTDPAVHDNAKFTCTKPQNRTNSPPPE